VQHLDPDDPESLLFDRLDDVARYILRDGIRLDDC
jgi:hypothetical protein